MEDLEVRLAVGQSHQVRLPGLGAAGYLWQWYVTPEAAAVRVRRLAAPEPASAPPGSSVDTVVEIVPTVPGSHTVRFEQRRPWETAVAPQDTRTLTVTAS